MPETATDLDAAGRFNAHFNDPKQWMEVKGVPVFDEHAEESEIEEPGPDGKPLKRKMVENFDKAALQEHADNCNRLVQTGNPPGLTIGHTKDEGDEKSQPETVGYAHNFRVGWNPTLGRNVIYQDERYRPDRYEEVKSYPYRSVERWRGGKYFKPIALLRREPRRNLGIVTYSAANRDTVIRYSMKGAAMQPPAPPMDPNLGMSQGQQAPNALPPGGGEDFAMLEPSEKDKHLHKKLMQAYAADPECMKALYAAISPLMTSTGPENTGAAGTGEPQVPPMQPAKPPETPKEPAAPKKDAAGGGMGSPSGSNTAPPVMEPQPMSASRNQADSEVVRYAKSLEARLASMERDGRIERYSAAMRDASVKYGVIYEEAEELTRVQDFTQPQFEQHLSHMVKRYEKRPVGRIRQGDFDVPPGQESQRMTKEQMEKAVQYSAEHPGCQWREAVEKTGGRMPTRNGHADGIFTGR